MVPNSLHHDPSMCSIVKNCELLDVDKDGDHMDDEEHGEERVEKQVALAEQVTFLPTVSSAAGSGSIWARGTSSQMLALC